MSEAIHIGDAAASVIADLRFRRHVRHLHSLGPRAVGELLAEIGREHAIRTAIEQKLERYARLTPEQIGTVGGEDFPPAPLRVVGGDE